MSPTAAHQESTTAPLTIKKKPPTSPSIDGMLSPNGHPSPGPSLSLNTSRPSTPKPSLKVNLAAISTAPPTDYSYYGGGNPMNPTSAPAPEEPTIRPDLATCIPAAPERKAEPLTDIKDLIGSFSRLSDSSASAQSSASGSDPESSPPDVSRLTYSDADLEEIARLGEGAGGAVHTVKDKRNGQIMARKTITTRGAPMQQLLRELSFSSSAVHRNIIPFYGAYMSPSTSEVKILMELCEGGSLEAIGKRIKERGGIIGEKIAGRIAEGVSQSPSYPPSPLIDYFSRSSKVSRICTAEKLSIETSNHQTSFSPGKVSSYYATLVSLASSRVLSLVLLLEPAFTWP
jgi:mitogen-activated protein kinase kinase